jgi:hypothetical protein
MNRNGKLMELPVRPAAAEKASSLAKAHASLKTIC